MPKVGTFLCNQGIVDQDKPEHLFCLSFDDASVNDPDWVDVTGEVRSFGSVRGRSSELSDMDAGTAQWLLDNRGREFDPTNAASPYYPNVRPMNRMWHRILWAGATYSVFTGWVENWPQTYPGMVDALVPVNGVDEFKPLALAALPTMNPPRDTYEDLVLSDDPVAYWRMGDAPLDRAQSAKAGPGLICTTGFGLSGLTTGAVTGENPDPYSATALDSTTTLATEPLETNGVPDLSGAAEFTVEFWFKTDDATPASNSVIAKGMETAGSQRQWDCYLTPGGVITFRARNATPTQFTLASTTVVNEAFWYHVLGTVTGGSLRLYVNGVQEASTAFTGVAETSTPPVLPATAGARVEFGTAAGSMSFYLDEVAIYRAGLTAARALAHYTAGVSRGFPREQITDARIIAALDTVSSRAPRSIRYGARNMTGVFMRGQSPLDELRDAVHAEAVDSTLFVAADGTVVFLDAAHRASSPWNTSQATFGDSGSELPYQDITLEYSDSFIANEWNVTTLDGLTQTASDSTSISRYGKRSQSITGLKITNGDSVALTVATDMLAKYKDPMLRIVGLQPNTSDGATLTATLALDLGDKIRVKRRPPGGGAAIDQQPWVQRIEVSGAPQDVYPIVKLGVSPV